MIRNLTTGAVLAEHNDIGTLFRKYAVEGSGIKSRDIVEMNHNIYPVSYLYWALYLNRGGEIRLTLMRM